MNSTRPQTYPITLCWKYTEPDGEKCAGETVVESQAEVIAAATYFLRRESHAYHCGETRFDLVSYAYKLADAEETEPGDIIAMWRCFILKLIDNREKQFYAYSGKWKFFDTAAELFRHSLTANGKRGSYYIKNERKK